MPANSNQRDPMQIVRDLDSLALVPDPAIRQMIQERIDAIASDEPYDAAQHGYFLVVDPGDSLGTISKQIGFDILADRWTGIRFGQPDYTPSFEFVELIDAIYDMLFIIDDSGYGIELLIPKTDGVDAELLAMCQNNGGS